MGLFYKNHSVVASETAVAAVAGKRIRIRRLWVNTEINGLLQVKQDIGGSPAVMLPTICLRGGQGWIDLRFDREIPTAAAGKNVGYTSDVDGTHSVWIEYELVD